MDGPRFDAFTKSLGVAGSRRRLLAGVAGAAAGMLGWEAATAKSHGGKCLATGKRCTQPAAGANHDSGTGKRKGKKKPPSCAKCCTGFGAPGPDGKPVCACKDDGKACDGNQCGNVLNNCGQTVNCGVETCAGFGTANSNVTCSNNGVCTFSCQGENYDVNGDKSDGCEATDVDGGNHTAANATRLPAQSCSDAVRTTFTGQILSDGRVHESPAIVGFDSTTGSAPDYWVVFGSGGSCFDDPNATITMTGGTAACYKFSIITDQKTASTPVDGNGAATITMSSASYTDGTDILFKIEKTCGTNVKETVDYKVTFNL